MLKALSWWIAHELFIVLVYIKEFDELKLIEFLNVDHDVFPEYREQLVRVELRVRVQQTVKEVHCEAQPDLVQLLLSPRAAKEVIRDDLIQPRRLELDLEQVVRQVAQLSQVYWRVFEVLDEGWHEVLPDIFILDATAGQGVNNLKDLFFCQLRVKLPSWFQ